MYRYKDIASAGVYRKFGCRGDVFRSSVARARYFKIGVIIDAICVRAVIVVRSVRLYRVCARDRDNNNDDNNDPRVCRNNGDLYGPAVP